MLDSWNDLGPHKSLELELVYELNDYEPSFEFIYAHFCKVDRVENLRAASGHSWVESLGCGGYEMKRDLSE